MLEIEIRLGLEAAAQIALRCRHQVAAIARVVNDLGIACNFRERASLYLVGEKLDAADLRDEHRLRAHADITGAYLADGQLAAQGFVGEGALLYPGSTEAGPVKLTLGLLAAAQARGAVLLCPATAENYETSLPGVTVTTRESDIVRARTLVLANGYEMPDFVSAPRHSMVSS